MNKLKTFCMNVINNSMKMLLLELHCSVYDNQDKSKVYYVFCPYKAGVLKILLNRYYFP